MQRLMNKALNVFTEIEAYLASLHHPRRCSNDEIHSTCKTYQDLLVLLNGLFLMLHLPNGNPTADDYNNANFFIQQSSKLWDILSLLITPKFHSLLDHALKQMQDLNGFGDMLEDDVECLHQLTARGLWRWNHLNNYGKVAFSMFTE